MIKKKVKKCKIKSIFFSVTYDLFSGELPLKYLPSDLYRYEMSNCLFEAAYEKILSDCNCTPSFHQVSISSTFYARIFCTKGNCEAFSSYVSAWCQKLLQKARA